MSTTNQTKDQNQDQADIDYLHPDGKPAATTKKTKSEEEYALAEKSTEKSIAEADGHHMCSSECQKHHQV
ncbi:MAG TPA: hypothetical protein V6C89_05105 [Drouetiella sp.]|jgi:hypothetical protein